MDKLHATLKLHISYQMFGSRDVSEQYQVEYNGMWVTLRYIQSFNHGGSCKACCAVLKCRPGTELFVVGVEEVGEGGEVSGTIDAIAFWH